MLIFVFKLGQVFLPLLRFSTNAPNSFSSTCYSYQKDEQEKPGNLLQSMPFFGNREALDRKLLSPFYVFKCSKKNTTNTNFMGNKIEHTTEHVADMAQNYIPNNFTYMGGSY
jgi:hypothetical protein